MTSISDPWTSLLTPTSSSSTSTPQADLTSTQQSQLKSLEDHFGAPGFVLALKEGQGDGGAKEGLGDREMMFLSRETFLRFLQATKYDLKATITRLEACLIWRRSERIDDLEFLGETCEPESRTGKNLVLGFSKNGQPLVYFYPNKNTTPLAERRPIFAVFVLERARDLMVDGVTNVVVMFHFGGSRQGPPTSISAARQTLYILSQYYPETLSLNIFQSVPWIVKAFINLMWPFVDPATKAKVKFDLDLVKEGVVDGGGLLVVNGGSLDLPYDHDKYWPALMNVCRERRSEQDELWRKGERKVGRSEREWKVSQQARDSTGEAQTVEL